MSWQLKGWLLLTSALVATALVASTAGARPTPSPHSAVLAGPSPTAGVAPEQRQLGKRDHHPRVTMVCWLT